MRNSLKFDFEKQLLYVYCSNGNNTFVELNHKNILDYKHSDDATVFSFSDMKTLESRINLISEEDFLYAVYSFVATYEYVRKKTNGKSKVLSIPQYCFYNATDNLYKFAFVSAEDSTSETSIKNFVWDLIFDAAYTSSDVDVVSELLNFLRASHKVSAEDVMLVIELCRYGEKIVTQYRKQSLSQNNDLQDDGEKSADVDTAFTDALQAVETQVDAAYAETTNVIEESKEKYSANVSADQSFNSVSTGECMSDFSDFLSDDIGFFGGYSKGTVPENMSREEEYLQSKNKTVTDFSSFLFGPSDCSSEIKSGVSEGSVDNSDIISESEETENEEKIDDAEDEVEIDSEYIEDEPFEEEIDDAEDEVEIDSEYIEYESFEEEIDDAENEVEIDSEYIEDEPFEEEIDDAEDEVEIDSEYIEYESFEEEIDDAENEVEIDSEYIEDESFEEEIDDAEDEVEIDSEYIEDEPFEEEIDDAEDEVEIDSEYIEDESFEEEIDDAENEVEIDSEYIEDEPFEEEIDDAEDRVVSDAVVIEELCAEKENNDKRYEDIWSYSSRSEPDSAELCFLSGETFNIVKPVCKIGRNSAWSDIKLNERRVSRQHAVIEYNNSNYYIYDVRSANGTYINGKKLLAGETKLLAEGDIIKIGIFELHFRYTNRK